jgi:hypothetical protein
MKSSSAICKESIPLSPHLAMTLGVPAALLIQQIHYWSRKQNHYRDGQYWVYKTLKEWADELRIFDAKTIQRSLDKLRAAGIIEVANYNKMKYDRTLWYRVQMDILSKCLATRFPDHEVVVNPDGQIVLIGNPIKSIPIPETTAETTSEKEAPPAATHPSPPSQLPGKKFLMVKAPSSAKAILQQLQDKSNGTPAVPPNTLKSAQAIWRTVPKYNETVKMMPEMTMVDRGRLSYIYRQWGPTADRNLRHLISHWVGFTKFVETQRGLKKTPMVPDLGFLQKYLGDGASFVLQSMQLIAEPAPSKPVLKKATKVKIPTAEQPAKQEDEEASMEDVLSWGKKIDE